MAEQPIEKLLIILVDSGTTQRIFPDTVHYREPINGLSARVSDALPNSNQQESWIDGIRGGSVFDAVVGTTFSGQDVTATMLTTTNGHMKIAYRCFADGLDVEVGDFIWSTKALAFKSAFGPQAGGGSGLNEAMAKAFMHMMEQGG